MTAIWIIILFLSFMTVICAAEYAADRYSEHLRMKRKQAARRKLDRRIM